jgi:NADH-quinone oxidoreductase subunit F
MNPERPPLSLEEYEKAGGYQAMRKALTSMEPEAVRATVEAAGLRGRGGAGFSTGRKWGFVPMGQDAPKPKYLTVNADEMEPATFKDRFLMEGDPHQVVEGTILSAYAIQAEMAYIFIRQCYPTAFKRVSMAIAEAYEKGYLGQNILGTGYNLELRIHESAGRYICGEETALLNALEGKRPNPRSKPPFPPLVGLWGKPTVTNNLETVCNVPHIVKNGAEWYMSLSLVEDGGTKIYGASGMVNRPGAFELPFGTPIREILDVHAGGMKNGKKLKAIIPGGASTGLLTPDHLDVRMDFTSVQAAGSRMGTGTMVFVDEGTCIVGLILNLMNFFARESCGWCTPCRDGLPWAVKLLAAIEAGQGTHEDLERLKTMPRHIAMGRTFCALGPGAMDPLQSALHYFEDDFKRHIQEKRCPWK